MNSDFSCPSCGHPMAIPAHRAGTTLYCTACNSPFVVPESIGGTVGTACPACGAAIDPGARFCGSCGAVTGVGASAEELVRRPAVITLLAVLNGIGGPLLLLLGFFALLGGAAEGDALGATLSVIYLVIGGVQLACAVGLWQLRPWGRQLQIGLSVFGLIGFPVGTLISVLILWYLFKPEIKLLFSGRPPEQLSPAELTVLARASTSGASLVAIIVGIFAAIFLCGIIAAIAIPNLLNAINRGRQKRSMADMRTIATAIEAYGADHQHYPEGAQSVADLEPALVPEYAVDLPAVDGWRTPFEVLTADDGSWYEIASLGRDKLPGDRVGGPTTDFDCDLVWANGQFIQWPEGIQTR